MRRAGEGEAVLCRERDGLWGQGMVRRPERYLPVMDLGLAATSATVPAASNGRRVRQRAGAEESSRWVERSRMASRSCSANEDGGIAEVAQQVQDHEIELGGIARVQADGGLRRARRSAPTRPRAERGGELDALRFAAGERRAGAVEVPEVVEADLFKENGCAGAPLQGCLPAISVCAGESWRSSRRPARR